MKLAKYLILLTFTSIPFSYANEIEVKELVEGERVEEVKTGREKDSKTDDVVNNTKTEEIVNQK